MKSFKQFTAQIPFKEFFSIFLENLQFIGVFLSIIIVLSFGLFLYRNFYTTIIAARDIVILEGELAQTAVDITTLQKVEQALLEKTKLPLYTWSSTQSLFGSTETIASDTAPINNTDQSTSDTSNEINISPRTSF